MFQVGLDGVVSVEYWLPRSPRPLKVEHRLRGLEYILRPGRHAGVQEFHLSYLASCSLSRPSFSAAGWIVFCKS